MFSGFEGDNVLNELGEPVVFGEDVKILSVQTDADLEPITSGQASLFFFPRGQTQLAHIQLEDEDGENAYTIKVQPLTGKVTVLPEKEDLPTPKTLYEMEDDLGEKIERRAF